MTFEAQVVFYAHYYLDSTETPIDEGAKTVSIVRELLEERYEMQAHRPLPKGKDKIFAHLVALQIIMDRRSLEAKGRLLAIETQEQASMKSMSVGDTRVDFGSDGGHSLSDALLNQDVRLQEEFDRLWKILIATTRRFLR